jgi:hypothetical protein
MLMLLRETNSYISRAVSQQDIVVEAKVLCVENQSLFDDVSCGL